MAAKAKREKHDAKDVARVREMRLKGMSLKEIAEKTGINRGTVGGMLYRKYGDNPAGVEYPGRKSETKPTKPRKPRARKAKEAASSEAPQ